MSDYEIVDSVLSLQGSDVNTIAPEDEPYFESYNYGKINDVIPENKDNHTHPHVAKFKEIIFKIYNDIYLSIFGYKAQNIENILHELNEHFRPIGISYQKFNTDINYFEMIVYLEDKYYRNIRSLISKSTDDKEIISDMIDNSIIAVIKDFYIKLGLASPNSNLSEDEYWNIKYDFISDLSLIFGISSLPSSDSYYLTDLLQF